MRNLFNASNLGRSMAVEGLYEKVFELAKRRGFLYPSYDIYGGVAGFYDYGPLGAAMKTNIENLWRRFYVVEEGFGEINTPVIGPEQVFKASGHLAGFSDVIIECQSCGEPHRADHLLRDELKRIRSSLEAKLKTLVAQAKDDHTRKDASRLGDHAREELENMIEKADKAASVELVTAMLRTSAGPARTEGFGQLQWNPTDVSFVITQGPKESWTEFVRCPACKVRIEASSKVYPFNLMFKTSVGPGSKRTGYMRPETAQGIFTDYAFLYRYFREQLPFGVVQIGKAFRNEISPRQGLLRLREFTQMEAEVFVDPKDGKKHPRFARMADLKVTLVPNSDEQPHAFTIGDAVAKKVVANEALAYFVGLTHRFLLSVGLEPAGIRFRQHRKDEMAHYANDCWDAEFHSERFGWVECVGIADRSAYDLTAHAKESGVELVAMRRYEAPREVRRTAVKPVGAKLGPLFKADAPKITAALKTMDGALARAGHALEVKLDGRVVKVPPECFTVEELVERSSGETFTPHVIEPSYGVDRILYAVLEHAYKEETKEVEGATETYRTMALPAMVAPLKAAVFPLVNKAGLPDLAEHIAHMLRATGLSTAYDDGGTIGRRYARMDEVGTPFCVTVDFETVEEGANKDTVTVRERDSGAQTRVRVHELAAWIRARIEAPLQKVLA